MYIRDKKQFDICIPQIKNEILSLLLYGKSVDVEIKEHKHKRSNEQNNYYWLFNTMLANFLNDSGCLYGEYKIPYTSQLIHDINKHLFGVETTTKMSVKEFCEYMTKLEIFWREKTNNCFEMPEPPLKYLERKGYTEDYTHGY